jgi:hypothetical protein
MSDIDDVFSRLRGPHPAGRDQREVRSIPRRGVSAGARLVEVVHLSPRATGSQPVPRRAEGRVWAASWENGFPARSRAPAIPSEPVGTPAGEKVDAGPGDGAVSDAANAPLVRAQPEPASEAHVAGKATRAALAARSVADPYDPADEGANCRRCGYRVEAGREQQGLMICAACA